MQVETADTKIDALEELLNGARLEADELRAQVARYEKIIVSTRLIMGHELKKPAIAISGYLDLVAEDVEANKEYKTLELVERAAEECALLGDLNSYFIDLLRMESRADLVGCESVDIHALVRGVVAYARRCDERRRVIPRLDLPEATVKIDGTALKLVLMNLVENAIYYSRVSTPIGLEAEQSFDRRGQTDKLLLKLRVVDEGVGIPEKYLSRVFEPFVRLHRDTADGSGLGLTLVRSLVELNGGDVSIQSRAGQGTTVHVTLPMSVGEEGDSITQP
jgi:signal transduction histidine kinase